MRKFVRNALAIALPVLTLSTCLIAHAAINAKAGNISQNRDKIVQTITEQAPNLKASVLNLALTAYEHAHLQGLDSQKVLTVIDYNMPSSEKRLWVINLNNDQVEYHTLVAQGKTTGVNYAKFFSNKHGSDASSIGTFVTGHTYHGEHGYSLRLHGLNPEFNGNAYTRDVVMHSAWYVSHAFDKAHGRVGRSWGCMALSQKMEPEVVSSIKNGTVIFSILP